MQSVYRGNPNATLFDFVDARKMVLINRRGIMTYDVLLQPDILRILRILDPGCELGPKVDLKKAEADAYAQEMTEAISSRLHLLVGAEKQAAIRETATRILWGTYSLLVENKKAGLNRYEPYYLAVRKSISDTV